MIRVLIADDHEIIRRGIRQILFESFPYVYTEEANNTDSLIDKAMNGKWDVVLCDLTMPGGGGITAMQKIKQKKPDLPFLFISMHPEEQYAHTIIKAGAAGYINKEAVMDELPQKIKRILSIPE